jgi:hypothetical protein
MFRAVAKEWPTGRGLHARRRRPLPFMRPQGSAANVASACSPVPAVIPTLGAAAFVVQETHVLSRDPPPELIERVAATPNARRRGYRLILTRSARGPPPHPRAPARLRPINRRPSAAFRACRPSRARQPLRLRLRGPAGRPGHSGLLRRFLEPRLGPRVARPGQISVPQRPLLGSLMGVPVGSVGARAAPLPSRPVLDFVGSHSRSFG